MKRTNYLKDAKARASQNIIIFKKTSRIASKKIGNSLDKVKIRWEKEGTKDISRYIKNSL